MTQVVDKHPIEVRPLAANDCHQLYYTFLEAFDDYQVPMQMSMEAFRRRFEDKINLYWKESVAAFSGEKMVGFLLHTLNEFGGKLSAYNAGTGVIRDYRGNGLTGHFYHTVLPALQMKGVEQCVLEVIDDNHVALQAYEKAGFQVSRTLRCYKRVRSLDSIQAIHPELQTIGFDEIPKNSEQEFDPSFLDTLQQLRLNKFEKVIGLRGANDEVVAYSIYQPHNGRIARIWVSTDQRGKGHGKFLVEEMQSTVPEGVSLTLINVPKQHDAADLFLKACGFDNQLNQFEMIKDISV